MLEVSSSVRRPDSLPNGNDEAMMDSIDANLG